jgi:hypothetical protein
VAPNSELAGPLRARRRRPRGARQPRHRPVPRRRNVDPKRLGRPVTPHMTRTKRAHILAYNPKRATPRPSPSLPPQCPRQRLRPQCHHPRRPPITREATGDAPAYRCLEFSCLSSPAVAAHRFSATANPAQREKCNTLRTHSCGCLRSRLEGGCTSFSVHYNTSGLERRCASKLWPKLDRAAVKNKEKPNQARCRDASRLSDR